MTTETVVSEARRMMERMPKKFRDVFIGAIAGTRSISHHNYTVTEFKDNSILIWSLNEGWLVLDEERTYYRDTVEHLARCLGTFTKERRAEMIGPEDKWIDGIHWSADGSYIGM